MSPPVLAPDEIVELHNALDATPLDEVAALQAMAWRARKLATKRTGDFFTALTAAQALMRSGQHDEAVAYARRAFDLRFRADVGLGELPGVCLQLGLNDEALQASREIIARAAYQNDEVALHNCTSAAFFCGDVDSLRRIAGLPGGGAARCILKALEDAHMTDLLSGHMTIVQKHLGDVCCRIYLQCDSFDDDPQELSFLVWHQLALPLRAGHKRSNAMAMELEQFYLDHDRADLAYGHLIAHGVAAMPAFRPSAT